MKKHILAIIGPSGCGKTTLVDHLSKTLHIPAIVSYTTRPMRPGETNGIEHYFVSENEMPKTEDMLAYTKFGNYHYWTTPQQVLEGINFYIIDEKGYLDVSSKIKQAWDEIIATNFGVNVSHIPTQCWDNMSKNTKIYSEFCVHPILIKRDLSLIADHIDNERISRDLDRIALPENCYVRIINNNGTLNQFLNKGSIQIQSFINTIQKTDTI